MSDDVPFPACFSESHNSMEGWLGGVEATGNKDSIGMHYMNLRNGRRSALGSGSGDDEEEETDPKMIQESESIELVELLDVRVKKKKGR